VQKARGALPGPLISLEVPDLKTRLLFVVAAACAAALGSSAPAVGVARAGAQVDAPGTVVSLLGDRDGFGYGLAEGDIRPTAPAHAFFDHREPGDPDFTDVNPIPVTWGLRQTVFSYEHQFDVPDGMSLAAASFNWFTLGIQDADRQVLGFETDIRLFLDGVEVPVAFDLVDQFDYYPLGWAEIAGSVSINVPPDLLRLFADGRVVVTFETHALGSHEGVDSYAIDFSQLTLLHREKTAVEQISDLIAVIDDYELDRLGSTLRSKLSTAARKLESKKPEPACSILTAFIKQVTARSGQGLTVAQAEELTVRAEDIKSAACHRP
jgi:hypothetical protein